MKHTHFFSDFGAESKWFDLKVWIIKIYKKYIFFKFFVISL